ncbi:MAG: TIR domain-containing protein [Cyanobacteria bacterium P01_F01_bin.143]
MTKIFISHSHADEAIADLLIDFLGEAMKIDKDDIRCTSDPNHGLDFSSSSISDQLKNDLKNATALIVIATIDSLKSPWLLFEVGSFWTTDKLVAPIIGPGLKIADLPGLLRGYRSIQIEKEDVFYELGELINQLEKKLDVKQIGASRRKDKKLNAFIKGFQDWKPKLSTITQSQKQEIEKLEAQIQELNKDLSEARSQSVHLQEKEEKIAHLENELLEARSQKETDQNEIIHLREQIEERSQQKLEINQKKQNQNFIEQLGELEMIFIPSGTLIMDLPEEDSNNKKSQHEVTVQAFYMGKFLITHALYQIIYALPISL